MQKEGKKIKKNYMYQLYLTHRTKRILLVTGCKKHKEKPPLLKAQQLRGLEGLTIYFCKRLNPIT